MEVVKHLVDPAKGLRCFPQENEMPQKSSLSRGVKCLHLEPSP